jgi:hypothetical protein
MNARWRDSAFRVVLAPLIMAGGLIVIAPAGASASACVAWTGVQPPNPGTSFNALSGVAVLSSCNAWAVGTYSSGSGVNQTLILHWNGAVWKQVPSPNSASARNFLTGVAAISATNIWAVGFTFTTATREQTLILHWNGTVWKQVPSPNPSSAGNPLTGVAATSARNAWAVGASFRPFGGERPLILHWNGTAWRSVVVPKHLDGIIGGVAATSASNAWAVGSPFVVGGPFILHWNGTAWRRVVIPKPGIREILSGVAATSARNAWAVGSSFPTERGQPIDTLILHWNGTAWKRVKSPTPNPRNNNFLKGVAATAARNAWAVGSFRTLSGNRTLILHWNGTAWKRVKSPDPSSTTNLLFGVAASSSRDIWAVGSYNNGTVPQTFALHCC